jgi:hypothetical protein
VCGAAYCVGTLTYDTTEATNKPCLRCLEAAYDNRDADCLRVVALACDANQDCSKAKACELTCSSLGKAAGDGGPDDGFTPPDGGL